MPKVDGQVVGRIAETIGCIGGQDVHRLVADIDSNVVQIVVHTPLGSVDAPSSPAAALWTKVRGQSDQPHVSRSIHRLSTLCSELRESSGISRQTDSQRTLPSIPAWITASCLILSWPRFLREVQAFVERVMAFQAVIGEDRSYFLIKTLFRL